MCSECPIGYYQNESLATTCTKCAANFNTSNTGIKDSTDCQRKYNYKT